MLCQSFLIAIVNETDPSSPVSAPARGLQVLILEPDTNVSAEIVSALAEAAPGARSAVAQSLGEVQDLVRDQKPVLFVLDVDATYDLAQEFICDLRTSHPNARAIILTAFHFSAQREQVAALGAIHFFEKPFPRADFITLVGALLGPGSETQAERFQGTLSDLHIADIIQLKCISGSTSMLEFTGPKGEKARVYFENGQIYHAVTPDKQGLAAFNAIVDWKGGLISEIPVPPGTPRTINIEWQVLLMDAVRHMDETRGLTAKGTAAGKSNSAQPKVLVIDDSMMLLDFVKEILGDEGYEVATAPNATQGLRLCHDLVPDVVLLDFLLPDMKGDEVCGHLLADPATAAIPVVFVSGFGNDLDPSRVQIPNVKGLLSKPFDSQALIKTIRDYLPKSMPLPNEFCFPVPGNEPLGAVETPARPIFEPLSLGKEPETPSTLSFVIDPMPPAVEAVSLVAPIEFTDANGSRSDEHSFTSRARATPADETHSSAPDNKRYPAAQAPALSAEKLEVAETQLSVANPVQHAEEIASRVIHAETIGSRVENNSPGSFDATGLPTTLAIDPSTGLISGTPSAVGTFSVILSATNTGGTGTATLTLTINPPAPTITSPLSVTAKVGQPFAYKITAANSPSIYSVTGLPAGVTSDPSTGSISGTPSAVGTFSVILDPYN
jgi:DNA-binding response OmpR family regulator